MGPGHMDFFVNCFFFVLHLYSIRLKAVLAQIVTVIVTMMLITIKKTIRVKFVGRDDTFFSRLLIYLRKSDSFE